MWHGTLSKSAYSSSFREVSAQVRSWRELEQLETGPVFTTSGSTLRFYEAGEIIIEQPSCNADGKEAKWHSLLVY